MNVLLGFDPGGDRRFGWCVCEDVEDLPLTVREAGCSGTVDDAIASASYQIRDGEHPIGVGIDAPMFWVRSTGRRVDREVRSAVRQAGAPYPPGTVQHVNSLRGACVAQGMLIAADLRELYPNLVVSECHPKALLWIIGNGGGAGALAAYVRGVEGRTEHERDAAIGCLSAWAAVRRPVGWRDLAILDHERYSPVAPVTYWMPQWEV